MAINPTYIKRPVGLIKIFHLIFGAITIGCGAASFESEFVFERVFLWSAVVCFVISFFYLLAHCGTESLPQSPANKGIDTIYHILGGILLLVGGSLMIVAVKKYNKEYCDPLPWGPPCQRKEKEKLTGGSFAIINGVFYLIAAGFIAVQKNDDLDWDPKIRGYPAKGYGSGRERAVGSDGAA